MISGRRMVNPKPKEDIMEKEIISNCCGWSITNDFCNKCNDHCSPLTEEELKELEVTYE